MTAPFRTTEDYELFLYTLGEQFPMVIINISLQISSITVFQRRR